MTDRNAEQYVDRLIPVAVRAQELITPNFDNDGRVLSVALQYPLPEVQDRLGVKISKLTSIFARLCDEMERNDGKTRS